MAFYYDLDKIFPIEIAKHRDVDEALNFYIYSFVYLCCGIFYF